MKHIGKISVVALALAFALSLAACGNSQQPAGGDSGNQNPPATTDNTGSGGTGTADNTTGTGNGSGDFPVALQRFVDDLFNVIIGQQLRNRVQHIALQPILFNAAVFARVGAFVHLIGALVILIPVLPTGITVSGITVAAFAAEHLPG